jgi:excinuclease UvrABC nuclease subunit
MLTEIPGIGPATQKKLIKAFGSVRALQSAASSEIAKVVGNKKAEMVKKVFKT